MSEAREFVSGRLDRLTQFWAGIAAFLGALIILSLAVMDYYAFPEKFATFLVYRLSCTLLMGLIFLLNRLKVRRWYQHNLVLFGTVIPTVMIELMIMETGGGMSPYYVGMILTVIFILGFVPVSMSISLVVVATVFGIYVTPIVALDRIGDASSFITNIAFVVATSGVAMAWRYLNQQNILNSFEMEYNLARDKQQLEKYSAGLETVVEERTRELNRSELMYRSLFEFAKDGILILDRGGHIYNANEEVCRLLGLSRDDVPGTHMTLLEDIEDRAAVIERIRRVMEGESLLYETQHRRPDGSMVSFEVSSHAIILEGERMVQSVYRDVTEKKRLERQLLHAQKMESVGHLAGGIAHDFNNYLTSILGSAEVILLQDHLDERVALNARNVEKAARKAALVVSSLLSFARRGGGESVIFTLNHIVADSLDMLSGMVPGTITVSRDLGDPSPSVRGDPGQIEQVIMNLVLNARDAMPEGGELRVRTSRVELGPSDLDIGIDIPAGRYAEMSVSDTGTGIPQENITHIFDPFFTTKEEGKGTGLGLAMVYGIVKEHKGYVTVSSTMGSGTTFRVFLPIAGPAGEAGTGKTALERGSGSAILVIDDDESVLDFIRNALQHFGYQVILTAHPEAAAGIFRRHQEEIRLVLTDLVMPGVDGPEVIRLIRATDPAACIVGMSGFGSEAGSLPVDAFLKKPFSASDLVKVIRRMLGPEGAS